MERVRTADGGGEVSAVVFEAERGGRWAGPAGAMVRGEVEGAGELAGLVRDEPRRDGLREDGSRGTDLAVAVERGAEGSRPARRGKGRAVCRHCGTPFAPNEREAEFCCPGCRYVHHLLHERGLAEFYRLGARPAPVGTEVFEERDWRWLERLQGQAEEAARRAGLEATAEARLRIQGISCAGCVWLIEELFEEREGAVSARADAAAGELVLRWRPGVLNLAEYAAEVLRFGYTLGPRGTEGPAPEAMRGLERRLGVCAALALNAMLFALPRYLGLEEGSALAAVFDLAGFLLAAGSFFVGGPVFFRRAWEALRRGEVHIDLPISLGLVAAFAGSVAAWRLGEHRFVYFDFVSVFTFLMLLGRWTQERAVEAGRRRLVAERVVPDLVRVEREGATVELPAEELREGDVFWLGRKAVLPVRARAVGGGAEFALNAITGEPAARLFPKGSEVPAGARLLAPAELRCEALEGWGQSLLARLLELQRARPWRNALLERVAKGYVGVMLAAAAAGFCFWGLVAGQWPEAWQVLVSVLVVSCPCAIGVALPLLEDLVAGRAQAWGAYVKEHGLWQRLRRVREVIFDKTGTITLEYLALKNRGELERLGVEERRVLLRLVHQSAHPVAASLREELLTMGVREGEGDGGSEVREWPGLGLEWVDGAGVRWRLGKGEFALGGCVADAEGTTAEAGMRCPEGGVREDEGERVVFSRDEKRLGGFDFYEELRPGAVAQVKGLLGRGLGVRLLSGDAPARVEELARRLGLPEQAAMGGLSPMDKERLVREQWAGRALFLGDGANDSLAFDAALVRGVPASGVGVLKHKADFYLPGRSLAAVGVLFDLARAQGRVAAGVVVFSVVYNAAAVGVALAGGMNPLIAAVLMPVSSLISTALVMAGLGRAGRLGGVEGSRAVAGMEGGGMSPARGLAFSESTLS